MVTLITGTARGSGSVTTVVVGATVGTVDVAGRVVGTGGRVVVLGRKDDGKVGIIVRVSDDLTGKIKAGEVIREIAPIVGGRGGGKPDMAEGGGSEPDKLSDAIDASYRVIENFLSS